MNISKLIEANRADEGEWLEVLFDGKPIGLRLLLVGKDSQIYRRHRHEMMTNISEKAKEGAEVAELSEKELCRLMAHCTREWEGADDDKGDAMPCTFENVLGVYEHSKLRFITDQVVRFVEDRSNFLSIPLDDSQKLPESEPA